MEPSTEHCAPAEGYEAIILAGGLGTRISALAPNIPKVMIEIGGRPFLEILLQMLESQGVAKVILATGYLHQVIERQIGNRWGSMQISYSVEDHPLGTGGAVWKALGTASREDVFVFNGDTLFAVDLDSFYRFHRKTQADVTLGLKPLRDFERYGAVELQDGRIVAFREKRKMTQGLINAGVYLISRQTAGRLELPEKFSLETDFLERYLGTLKLGGFIHDGYFIDIGVPEDYARAQIELTQFPSIPSQDGGRS